MNNRNCIYTLLIALMVLTSCGKENINGNVDENFGKDLNNYSASLEKSSRSWLNYKTAHNNSYQYKVEGASWTGTSWQTSFTVVNGKVTQRQFELKCLGVIEISWIEYENEIGINKLGAEPLTLDQIYDKARTEWLIKRKNTEFFFETDKNGLISLCGYVEKYCMDDCFRGVRISYIKPI